MNEPDVWALWPDDFMCPLAEVDDWLRWGTGVARSDDYTLVNVLEYGEDDMPLWWTPHKA